MKVGEIWAFKGDLIQIRGIYKDIVICRKLMINPSNRSDIKEFNETDSMFRQPVKMDRLIKYSIKIADSIDDEQKLIDFSTCESISINEDSYITYKDRGEVEIFIETSKRLPNYGYIQRDKKLNDLL